MDYLSHRFEIALGEAAFVKRKFLRTFIQNTENYRFAVNARKSRNTEVDIVSGDFDLDVSVLRQ